MKYYVKKSNISSIVMMITIFLVVIILMIFSSKMGPPSLNDPLSKLSDDVGLYKGRYFNKPFHFALSAPDTNNWSFSYPLQIDSTYIDKTDKTNPKEIVRLIRLDEADTLAITKVELYKLTELTKIQKLASEDLAFILDLQRKNNETISIVSDVTVVGSVGLTAAFHVIEFSKKTLQNYPVWVTMYVIRNNIVYKIICISKREKYEELKSEFEKILKDIRFI